ncbi:hypothetical protein ACFOLC_12045 [Lysobacter cavernae]|uniref:Carboxypeptidase regulatory-like domain-containing protein n=1 Tax=Lysobacter cavernae TaxID=1685901 RepID=A0ABV7RQT9_9GAMM
MACVLLSSLASGCKEVQDIREELGWAKPAEAKPIPVVASLETHWVPAEAAVADVGQAQWSARWWQWAGRFPGVNELPYRDPDGRRCAQYQEEGPVWFLAGTDGAFDAVRSCRIPANKHLFVPLINWMASRGLQGAPMSCAEKQAQASRQADHVVSGLVLLDGRPVGELQRMRVASGTCFDGAPGEGAAASDGYWLMLKPLPPGKHQLAIAAAFRDGPRQMLQNFRYELEVEGDPAEVAGAVQ